MTAFSIVARQSNNKKIEEKIKFESLSIINRRRVRINLKMERMQPVTQPKASRNACLPFLVFSFQRSI
jgi:hypothetical protein